MLAFNIDLYSIPIIANNKREKEVPAGITSTFNTLMFNKEYQIKTIDRLLHRLSRIHIIQMRDATNHPYLLYYS